MRRDTVHRLGERASVNRAVTPSLARTTLAPTPPPPTPMAQAGVTPAFLPGAAYTGRPVASAVATTPPSTGKDLNTVALTAYAPTFAAIRTDYSPVQQLPVGPYNPGPLQSASLASGKASMVSRQTVVIIAAAGGGGLALVILLSSWWCWRKREAQRKWWRLNAEHSAGPTIGRPRQVDSKDYEMDKSDFKPQEKGWGGFRSRTTTEEDHLPPELSYSAFASPDRSTSNANAAREELLGGGRGGERKKNAWSTAALSDVISYRSTSAQSNAHTPQPTTPYRSPLNPTTPNRSPLDNSGTGYPFPDMTPPPPSRPVRHSDAVTEPYFGRGHDERDLPGSEGLDERFMDMMKGPAGWDQGSNAPTSRNLEANGRQQKVDTIMDLTDAYGRYADDDDASMPSFGGQNAWGQVNAEQPLPRLPNARSAAPPPDSDLSRQLYSNTLEMDSFPPAPPPAASANRQPSRYSRVDSRPLHDLEHILESFDYDSKGGLAPAHDTDSLRTMSVSSDFTVAPLTIKRNPSQASQGSSHPMPSNRIRPPSSTGYGRVESMYTDGGDLGGHVAFNGHTNHSLPSPRQSQSARRPPPPPIPMSRNPSQESRHHLYGGSDRDAMTPSPMETHAVRRISLKRGADPPVRLNREPSLGDQSRRGDGQQQALRRKDYPQDDGPRTDSRGFIPLAAMSTLDPGSYRSATESMYGMYDD